MLERLRNELLLTTDRFAPSDPLMEIAGIFNPGVALYGDEIVLLVRVAEAHVYTTDDVFFSPRIRNDGQSISYEFERCEPEGGGASISLSQSNLRHKARLPHISHFEIVRLDREGYNVKSIERHPQLFGGVLAHEEYGIEDARITQIGDTYYITYVAVSSTMNVCSCLMTTKDFSTFERRGIILPCENKDVVIHPEKVGGMYMCYHRPVPTMQFLRPSIWTALSPDLVHWGRHELFLPVTEFPEWDSYRNGAGTTAIRTQAGWLQLYHGVRLIDDGQRPYYSAGAVLASLENPRNVIAKSKKPLLVPEKDFEKTGYIGNVVFPTGWAPVVEDADRMVLYYGCADTNIAAVTVSVENILGTLEVIGIVFCCMRCAAARAL